MFTNVDGKVNVDDFSAYAIGDKGKAITALRPEGKAIIYPANNITNDQRITVYSIGDFIDEKTAIKIIKIEHNKIFVKPDK